MTSPIRSVVLAAVLSAVGCGGGTADVAGKVTHKGKPVVYGTVVLVGSDGLPKSGTIQPDGTFRVAGVATGTAKVAVSSPPPPGAGSPAKRPRGGRDEEDERTPAAQPPAAPEVIRNWTALPEKYGDPDKSGLTAEVRAGQPVNLDLP